MKFINELLYVETADFVAAGLKAANIWKAVSVGNSTLPNVKDPANAKLNLYPYEQLGQKYKAAILDHFGDPYRYLAREPIKSLVKPHHEAQEYFINYRYEGSKSLPQEHVIKYTRAAGWLRMLGEVMKDKKMLKKALGLKLDAFWSHVCDIIRSEKIDLPASYQRLRAAMATFEAQGFESLIDWRFGNKLAAKVKDELSESVLLELIAMPNQHDDAIIARAYNKWAAAHNYKTIDAVTVGNHRRKNNWQLMAQRQGNAAWYNTYGKIIHRNRPSAPMLLLGSDDNVLDLYFRDNRRSKVNPYFRYSLILVMDAHNDYVLGWSYGETVTAEVVRAAYLDAMYHIRQLTGSWFLPHQIQTDRWGFKALEPFYSSLAVYTPAAARSARGKYIEQAFGTTWHQELKKFTNYAGHNITSRQRLNPDAVEINKGSFPSIDQAPHYIEAFVQNLRNLSKASGGPTRQEAWIEQFHKSELARQHQISDTRMLMLFGRQHKHTNTITNGGIQVTLNGELRIYDVPDEYYLQVVGKQVQITYDPYDYNRVLVSDGGNLRFVATTFDHIPGAIADHQSGDRNRLNALLLEKRMHVARIGQARTERNSLIEKHEVNAAGLLQAGVLVKEERHAAERQLHCGVLPATPAEPGFNPYADM